MARELAPAGLRSSPNPAQAAQSQVIRIDLFTTAAQPSGSKLPRHKSASTTEEAVLRWDEVIEHPVHRQFTQHDGVLDAEHGIALRAVQLPREITQHHARRRQGLAGVDQ